MKIEDIDITDEHIGKEVTLHRGIGRIYFGIILSYSDRCVFVKYDGDDIKQATLPEYLYWEDRKEEFEIKEEIIYSLGLKGILNVNNFTYREATPDEDSRLSELLVYKDGELLTYLKSIRVDGTLQTYGVSDEKKKKVKRNLNIDSLV